MSSSAVSIFKHLCENLPPLFPEEKAMEMRHALAHLENDPTVSPRATEDTLIKFGFEVWPWNQAYREFLNSAEGRMGEHFLLPALSGMLQEKFAEYKEYGLTMNDFYSGRVAEYFTPEERMEILPALERMKKCLKEYVRRDIVSLNQRQYLNKVEEFNSLLEEIKVQIQQLKNLSDREDSHPSLADEMRSKIRGFEESLCGLGPEIHFSTVAKSIEFFDERKKHLNRLRGIHLTKEINFYE
ncbi:MAG: hypothetical protein COU29_01875 [Candidatus Magasanikbacteria bacterium CG10_big_fil_rev_8_21_14_0_10_36_32]|uniref:Uncharacterized protein n=1 Tax=Candidatus Magasanikbacteria bacterium CG10_big_fil_rev_8_21_14_0_10_36_32 TaxID=1974646 RepID=A0A2M6W6T9_9BACT|nr:MAG: hypothetical protein COU29_01875 [Candidatus Magasanikbacteria bacterium CG10_big_fil_rev_8_21_14_0_10_36_32]